MQYTFQLPISLSVTSAYILFTDICSWLLQWLQSVTMQALDVYHLKNMYNQEEDNMME